MGEYLLGCLSGIFLSIIVFGILDKHTIKPIDVYEGKTTLKYEVVDSIRVDSTVIWKKDFKK